VFTLQYHKRKTRTRAEIHSTVFDHLNHEDSVKGYIYLDEKVKRYINKLR